MLDNTEAPGLLAHHVCFGGELCDSLGLLEGGVRGKRWCECSTKTKKVLVHGAWYHGGAIAVSAPCCFGRDSWMIPGLSEGGGEKCESVGLLEGGVQRKTKTTKSQIWQVSVHGGAIAALLLSLTATGGEIRPTVWAPASSVSTLGFLGNFKKVGKLARLDERIKDGISWLLSFRSKKCKIGFSYLCPRLYLTELKHLNLWLRRQPWCITSCTSCTQVVFNWY